MSEALHLGDEVEFVTDAYAGEGVARGAIGEIVDDWADGSNDVEVHDQHTGELIAKIRAGVDEIRLYTGPVEVKEPREHGIIFGRGDELADDVEAPPQSPGSPLVPISLAGRLPFDVPPETDAQIVGDIPWELQDPPQTGPIIL